MLNRLISPRTLVLAARVLLGPAVFLLIAMAGGPPPPLQAEVALVFVVALLTLLAFPKRRHGDLMGCLVILMTFMEWLAAGNVGHFDVPGWSYGICVAGAVTISLRVQHFRTLARQDPYVALRHLERRNVMFGRTTAQPSRSNPSAAGAAAQRKPHNHIAPTRLSALTEELHPPR